MSTGAEAGRPAQEILPLSGVKVVDLSQIGAGPYGTSMLGDLGADVIKVEPLNGDSFRYVDNAYAPGESAYFFGVNRSKRSMALNLKDPAGYEVLMRLVREADVFVVAFRPDAIERMGVDYETLRAVNPRLVYAAITAFGEDGPRAHQPGMDILAQALSGMMGVTGEVGGGPVKVGVPIADFVGSFFLGFGVCAALRLRDQTGVGDKIMINLLDGQIAAFANYITAYDKTRVKFRPLGGGHPQLVPYQPFLGSDDRYFILACLNDHFWEKLVPYLNQFDDFSDPRYATNTDRIAHRDELCGRLQDLFSTQPASYWLEGLEATGVPCSPIHRMEEALEDPQVMHNQSVVELEHPRFGAYKVPNNPIRFLHAATGPRGYAPGLGEHTDEILAEYGLSAEQIQSLRDRGIVNSTFAREPA
ncbi:CaiB/BaiF CoA transferase family protein [Sinomonas sp. P10A9]|uniref:CaiB/BaiF CoA transferase family protein n=1 Tax=Sinomonas puerhi TaxID=3238584 RepID=A0AB39L6W3_9MICC